MGSNTVLTTTALPKPKPNRQMDIPKTKQHPPGQIPSPPGPDPRLGRQRGVFPKGARVLLPHQLKARAARRQQQRDQGLRNPGKGSGPFLLSPCVSVRFKVFCFFSVFLFFPFFCFFSSGGSQNGCGSKLRSNMACPGKWKRRLKPAVCPAA